MRKNFIPLCAVVGLLLTRAACGPGRDRVERLVEDGVEVTVNHLKPYRTGVPGTFTLDELFQIDTEDEKISDLGLTDIRGFAVGAAGDIVALKMAGGDGDFLYRFDSNGRFVRSFGRRGQGPGEFQNPHFIAFAADDHALVIDPVRSALIEYDLEGILIDEKRVSESLIVSSGPGDTLLRITGQTTPGEKGEMIYAFELHLVGRDLEKIAFLDGFEFEFRRDRVEWPQPVFCWDASRESIFVVNQNRGYDIWVFDSGGTLVRKIRKSHRPVPFTEVHREQSLKQFPEGTRERMKNIVVFPDFFPSVQGLAAVDDGTLLVQTFEQGTNPGEFMFDIFNPEGVFIGRKSLNIYIWENILWARIKGNTLYCLEEKPSGFKRLAVYRMIW